MLTFALLSWSAGIYVLSSVEILQLRNIGLVCRSSDKLCKLSEGGKYTLSMDLSPMFNLVSPLGLEVER